MLQIAPRGPNRPPMLELHAVFAQVAACVAVGRLADAAEWTFQREDMRHDINHGRKKTRRLPSPGFLELKVLTGF